MIIRKKKVLGSTTQKAQWPNDNTEKSLRFHGSKSPMAERQSIKVFNSRPKKPSGRIIIQKSSLVPWPKKPNGQTIIRKKVFGLKT